MYRFHLRKSSNDQKTLQQNKYKNTRQADEQRSCLSCLQFEKERLRESLDAAKEPAETSDQENWFEKRARALMNRTQTDDGDETLSQTKSKEQIRHNRKRERQQNLEVECSQLIADADTIYPSIYISGWENNDMRNEHMSVVMDYCNPFVQDASIRHIEFETYSMLKFSLEEIIVQVLRGLLKQLKRDPRFRKTVGLRIELGFRFLGSPSCPKAGDRDDTNIKSKRQSMYRKNELGIEKVKRLLSSSNVVEIQDSDIIEQELNDTQMKHNCNRLITKLLEISSREKLDRRNARKIRKCMITNEDKQRNMKELEELKNIDEVHSKTSCLVNSESDLFAKLDRLDDHLIVRKVKYVEELDRSGVMGGQESDIGNRSVFKDDEPIDGVKIIEEVMERHNLSGCSAMNAFVVR